MKLHEYQAKALLASYGIVVPEGEVAATAQEAWAVAARLGERVVVKAQVHAGGRGKAGGVQVAHPFRRSHRNPQHGSIHRYSTDHLAHSAP